MKLQSNTTIVASLIGGMISGASLALACSAGGASTKNIPLGNGSDHTHTFTDQCLAKANTDVTITLTAMADLGCVAWDAVRHAPSDTDDCESCSPVGQDCCDIDPELKYLTVTVNGYSLNPDVAGSTNMPNEGKFFRYWNNNNTSTPEYGLSICTGGVIAANRHIVKIPAATWNTWLGSSGNDVSVQV